MGDSNDPSEWAGEPRTTKVAGLIAEYELDGLGDELESRWTGQNGKRDSLRTLADVFNRRLLERAMTDAGLTPLDGEIENVYRLLTADDVSSGTRTETEARLRRDGVDVDKLRSDFVTYQAIRTYLQDVRDASYEDNSEDAVEKARSNFLQIVGRTTAVIDQRLDQLKRTDRIALGSYSVQTSVTIYCEDCQSQFEAADLLAQGGCDCAPDDRR